MCGGPTLCSALFPAGIPGQARWGSDTKSVRARARSLYREVREELGTGSRSAGDNSCQRLLPVRELPVLWVQIPALSFPVLEQVI